MRVYSVLFRTPGIFLDEDGNNFKGNLTFELLLNGTWTNINQVPGIKVIQDTNFQLNSFSSKLYTVENLKVPKRNEGILKYDFILQDDASYKYRIVADGCPECWDLFKENEGYQGEILDYDNRRGRIVVGSGIIGQQQPDS